VERRTHQSLNVPTQKGQTVYQTLIDLEVQEYNGGYQVARATHCNILQQTA